VGGCTRFKLWHHTHALAKITGSETLGGEVKDYYCVFSSPAPHIGGEQSCYYVDNTAEHMIWDWDTAKLFDKQLYVNSITVSQNPLIVGTEYQWTIEVQKLYYKNVLESKVITMTVAQLKSQDEITLEKKVSGYLTPYEGNVELTTIGPIKAWFDDKSTSTTNMDSSIYACYDGNEDDTCDYESQSMCAGKNSEWHNGYCCGD
jgi:hypothetical protein